MLASTQAPISAMEPIGAASGATSTPVASRRNCRSPHRTPWLCRSAFGKARTAARSPLSNAAAKPPLIAALVSPATLLHTPSPPANAAVLLSSGQLPPLRQARAIDVRWDKRPGLASGGDPMSGYFVLE